MRLRLEAIEQRLGLLSTDRGTDPRDVAQQRVEDGTARPLDFLTAFSLYIPTTQAILAEHARAYRRRLASGYDVQVWHPLGVAAGIAAFPPEETPPDELIEGLLAWAVWTPTGGTKSGPRQKAEAWFHQQWVVTGIYLTGLVTPDGLPLRAAIAAGELDGAEITVKEADLDHCLPSSFLPADARIASDNPQIRFVGHNIVPPSQPRPRP